ILEVSRPHSTEEPRPHDHPTSPPRHSDRPLAGRGRSDPANDGRPRRRLAPRRVLTARPPRSRRPQHQPPGRPVNAPPTNEVTVFEKVGTTEQTCNLGHDGVTVPER